MKHPNFEVCYWETSTRWELTMILAVYEPFMDLNRIYRELVEFTVWIPVAKFCLFENDQSSNPDLAGSNR